jgi:hypothetical protein
MKYNMDEFDALLNEIVGASEITSVATGSPAGSKIAHSFF